MRISGLSQIFEVDREQFVINDTEYSEPHIPKRKKEGHMIAVFVK